MPQKLTMPPQDPLAISCFECLQFLSYFFLLSFPFSGHTHIFEDSQLEDLYVGDFCNFILNFDEEIIPRIGRIYARDSAYSLHSCLGDKTNI